jgi:hypothetical protein
MHNAQNFNRDHNRKYVENINFFFVMALNAPQKVKRKPKYECRKPTSGLWQHMQPVIYDYGCFAILHPANTEVCVWIFFFIYLCSGPKGHVMFRTVYEGHVTPEHNTLPMNWWRNFLTMTNDWPCCGFSTIAYLTGTVLTNIYCSTCTTQPMPHHQYCVIKFYHGFKNSSLSNPVLGSGTDFLNAPFLLCV